MHTKFLDNNTIVVQTKIEWLSYEKYGINGNYSAAYKECPFVYFILT